jgi:DegV family protein with EDD domain
MKSTGGTFMGKIAVISDSNSGISPQEAKELGIYIIPMPFFINGETYYEGENLTQEQFYERLKDGSEISTSMPSVGSLTDLWDELLCAYDEIVHIPMSSGLSSSCETAMMLANDYEDKVFVVNNQRISVTQRQSVLDAKALADKGRTAAEIKEILEREKLESSIYIMVDTLAYLKKGGRITPAAAALGTLLRLKPVLQIQGDKLDAFAKARTVKQAKTIMLDAMKNDLANRFADAKGQNVHLEMAYTYDLEAAEAFRAEVLAAFPDSEIVLNPLSLSVSCHIGPGALAIACSKKIPELLSEGGN